MGALDGGFVGSEGEAVVVHIPQGAAWDYQLNYHLLMQLSQARRDRVIGVAAAE